MTRNPETGTHVPEEDSRTEVGHEIEWVYTASLSHVDGKPDMQVTLGVPQHVEAARGWLQPAEPGSTDNGRFRFELPVNVIIGDQAIKCTTSGFVSRNSNGSLSLQEQSFSPHSSPSDT